MIVYYLEDEFFLCEMFKEYISDHDITVVTFTESYLAVKSCELNKPDLIFIDYRLADVTGDKVATKIDSSIPKILVTGELELPVVDGFDMIISKPYNLSNMKIIVDKYRKDE